MRRPMSLEEYIKVHFCVDSDDFVNEYVLVLERYVPLLTEVNRMGEERQAMQVDAQEAKR